MQTSAHRWTSPTIVSEPLMVTEGWSITGLQATPSLRKLATSSENGRVFV
jgi:hypothetical protein